MDYKDNQNQPNEAPPAEKTGAVPSSSRPRIKGKELAKMLLWIIAIVVLLLLGYNQFLGFKYKAQVLADPCAVCASSNPIVSMCINNKVNSTANGSVNTGIIPIDYTIKLFAFPLLREVNS